MGSLELCLGPDPGTREPLGPEAWVLRGFALPDAERLLSGVDDIQAASPFRHMVTPGGYTMSAALTSCGSRGWTTDRQGYRYAPADPLSGRPWPPIPDEFAALARRAARDAGFPDFEPDACLVNRYVPGSRMSLHQDRNERDFRAPVVSVSLGMTAVFLWGGNRRADKAAKIPLYHGDVVVWGGRDRLRYHGIMPLKDSPHPVLGSQRINITFRKAA